MSASMTDRLLSFAVLYALLCVPTASFAQSPYVLGVHTDSNNDTLMQGVEGALIFGVESPGGLPAASFTWALKLTFSGGHLMGPMVDSFWQGVQPSAVVNVYHLKRPGIWSQNLRPRFYTTNPDTVIVGAHYFQEAWQGSGEQWRIVFTPADTGVIMIDTVSAWPFIHHSVLAWDGEEHPFVWQGKSIVVVPYCLTGDAKADSQITAADAIHLIGYVFKNGPPPIPCPAFGDVNCSGTVTSADIIALLNFIFRGGPRPCYSCALIEQGVWTCP